MSVSSHLESSSLSPTERRTLERFLALLEQRLGTRIVSVWLYGSRARGEDPHPESDVDLMVVSEGGTRDRDVVHELLFDAADYVGENPFRFSVQVVDPAWVRGRREIRSFFIQEVDRDKRVLAGAP
jgi:predicted nucleotidyltransferase